MEYVIPGIDFSFQPDAYGWDMTKTPKVTTFPYTFATPIPFEFKIRWGYLDRAAGNVQVERIVEGSGTMTGYAADSYRPYIALQLAQPLDPEDPENLDSIGLTIYNDSITFGNDLVIKETLIHDDIIQHTDTYNTFNQIFRRTTWEVDLSTIWMDVEYCDLPIIMMYGQIPVSDDEYIYQQTEYTQISASQIPTLDRIMSWSGNSYIEPAGQDFTLSVIAAPQEWTQYGMSLTGAYQYQQLRGKILSGKIALYTIPGISSGKLVYGINSTAEFYGLEYSNDGTTWHEADFLPYSYIYRQREDELGSFTAAISAVNTKLPIFDSALNAQGYINGSVPISEALNWGKISDAYPEYNGTGDDDSETTFGSVTSRSFFTQQYIISTGGIQEISNALYDTNPSGLWEDIKKGLDMFGANPMDAVVSLMYYPVSLDSVFTDKAGASPDIYFGGYKFTMTNNSAYKLIHPNGHFSCGSVKIEPTFGIDNYKSYPPYTRLYVEIPYCGRYELDPAKYYNKYTELRYYIDTRTGACVACFITGGDGSGNGGHLVDSFQGQIGSQIPITLTDFSAYANAQINTLLGGGGQALQGATDLGKAASGVTSVAGAASLGVGAAAFGAVQGAKTVYGLTQNNINKFNQTKGGSTAMLNQYLPQKAVFCFEIQEENNPDNFGAMQGYPSNAGGVVGNFAGYFEAEQIKLSMPGATQGEKEKARALLMGGVFI